MSDPATRSAPERPRNGGRPLLRRIGTITVTLAVIGAAAGAVVLGIDAVSRTPDGEAGVIAPLMPVGVMQVVIEPGYAVTRRFTGQIEAAATTDLGFELGGRITRVLVDEGDRVAAGDVLAVLDRAALGPERTALEAELAALAADAELARLTLERNDRLTERGFRSVATQDDARLSLARAEARMAALRAQIAGVDVRLEKSRLVAPFDALIGARLSDPGQTAAAGQPVLVLFDVGRPRLRVGLPPDLAAMLAPGDAVTVRVNGADRPARVVHIRPDLDPGTRSRAVLLALDDRPQADRGQAAFGQTAGFELRQQIDEPGFWAPLAALREGARGSWSVMAVEVTPGGDRVVPAAVEVIHIDGARVFLRGLLPPGARIVAEGPDRVAPGQIVLALAE